MLREFVSGLIVCSATICGGVALALEPLPPAPLPPTMSEDAQSLASPNLYGGRDGLTEEGRANRSAGESSSATAGCATSSCAYALDCKDVCCEDCEPLCADLCGDCPDDAGPLCSDLCGEACDDEGCASECGCSCGCSSCGDCCSSARRPCQWYIVAGGGGMIREVAKEEGNGSTFMDFHSGFILNTALGCDLDGVRLEIETSFMNNEVERAGADGFNSGSEGNVTLRAYMLNIYRDFWLPGLNCTPYIGAGVGVYQAEFNGVYPNYFDAVGAPLEDDPINATSDTPFAFQLRAGVSRPLGCRSELYSGYRYFKGSELEFASGPFSAAGGPIFRQDGAEVHAVEMGVRVRF